MTKQEIFNRVWHHVAKQGQPSRAKSGVCLYRGPRGLQCAIGIFLPEETARLFDRQHNRNGLSIKKAIEKWPELIPPELLEVPLAFLEALQDAHDGPAAGPTWADKCQSDLRYVATKYDLTIPA